MKERKIMTNKYFNSVLNLVFKHFPIPKSKWKYFFWIVEWKWEKTLRWILPFIFVFAEKVFKCF